VLVDDGVLHVFYSRIGDSPERIVLSVVDLAGDWSTWAAGPATTVLQPETDHEGVFLPVHPSRPGMAPDPVRELRDPAVLREGDRVYLAYSTAGEQGIAVAQGHLQSLRDHARRLVPPRP